MPDLRERIRWHREMVDGLRGYRSRYRNWLDWTRLPLCYTAHTLAGAAGVRHLRYRTRIPGDPDPIGLRLGSSDFHTMIEIFFKDAYGFALPALQGLPGGVRTIVDLGANAGYTVRLWDRHFPECRVVAVEPDAGNLALCMDNVTQAARHRVAGVRCFAGGTAGTAFLDRSLDSWAYRLTTEAPDGQEPTPVRTVPEILADTPLADAEIDLLKCDIEGSEVDVFAGGPAWLRRVRAIVAEVHPPYTPEALAADVRSGGDTWTVRAQGDVVLLTKVTPR